MDIQLVSFSRSNCLTKFKHSHIFQVIGTPQNKYRGSCYFREGRVILFRFIFWFSGILCKRVYTFLLWDCILLYYGFHFWGYDLSYGLRCLITDLDSLLSLGKFDETMSFTALLYPAIHLLSVVICPLMIQNPELN